MGRSCGTAGGRRRLTNSKWRWQDYLHIFRANLPTEIYSALAIAQFAQEQTILVQEILESEPSFGLREELSEQSERLRFVLSHYTVPTMIFCRRPSLA